MKLTNLIKTFADIEKVAVCSDANVPASIKEASGCNAGNDLDVVVAKILSSIIAAMGTVAVIFIIVGGSKYITSNGDASKIQSAKNTILYSVIGLVICALAFVIVNYAINTINGKVSADNYTNESSCINAGYEWDEKANKCK